MSIRSEGDRIHYRAQRMHGPRPAEFRGAYMPVAPPARSEPGSLEHFLTERYCLYTVDGPRVFRADIHHLPWPLQRAEAEIELNTMTAPLNIMLPFEQPLLHYARRLDVLVWPPERLR